MCCCGLKKVHRILLRQAATASLEPEKSTGAPRKTTAHPERKLFGMVSEDHSKGARALNESMRNLYGVRVGRKTINNWLVVRGYHALGILRKPLPAPPRLGTEVAEIDCGRLVPRHLWRWATSSAVPCRWPHGSLSTAGRALPARPPDWGGGGGGGGGAFHGGVTLPFVLLVRNVDGVYRDILRDTLVPFARQHFGDDFRYKEDNATPHRSSVVTDYLQKRTSLKWTSLHNPLTATPSSICGTNWVVQSQHESSPTKRP